MPIQKTSDDYIDQLHDIIQQHYRFHIPKRMTRLIIKQFQLSIIHHLKQGNHIYLKPFLSLSLSSLPKRPYNIYINKNNATAKKK